MPASSRVKKRERERKKEREREKGKKKKEKKSPTPPTPRVEEGPEVSYSCVKAPPPRVIRTRPCVSNARPRNSKLSCSFSFYSWLLTLLSTLSPLEREITPITLLIFCWGCDFLVSSDFLPSSVLFFLFLFSPLDFSFFFILLIGFSGSFENVRRWFKAWKVENQRTRRELSNCE